jgi:hypothetical protein
MQSDEGNSHVLEIKTGVLRALSGLVSRASDAQLQGVPPHPELYV